MAEALLIQLPGLPAGNLSRFREDFSFRRVLSLRLNTSVSAIDVHAAPCARVRVTGFLQITGIDYTGEAA